MCRTPAPEVSEIDAVTDYCVFASARAADALIFQPVSMISAVVTGRTCVVLAVARDGVVRRVIPHCLVSAIPPLADPLLDPIDAAVATVRPDSVVDVLSVLGHQVGVEPHVVVSELGVGAVL